MGKDGNPGTEIGIAQQFEKSLKIAASSGLGPESVTLLFGRVHARQMSRTGDGDQASEGGQRASVERRGRFDPIDIDLDVFGS